MTNRRSCGPSGEASRRSWKPKQKNSPRKPKRALESLQIRSLKHLAHHLGCSVTELEKYAADPERFYREGVIPGKKPRPKCTPKSPRLKGVLKRLNDLLQRLDLDPAAHGGRRGRSTITNALPHVHQKLLVQLDIQDFFPSVTREMVREALVSRCGCTPDVATALSAITTPFNALPQGSPHSTIMAAVVVDHMVRRLRGLAERHHGTCSQYVDDTTLSGPLYLERMKGLAARIVEDEGFRVHPDKLKVVPSDQEQEVTGWGVNDGLRAPREKIREVYLRIKRIRDYPPPPSDIASLLGQIEHFRRAEPGTAKQLRRRLLRALRLHGIEIE